MIDMLTTLINNGSLFIVFDISNDVMPCLQLIQGKENKSNLLTHPKQAICMFKFLKRVTALNQEI